MSTREYLDYLDTPEWWAIRRGALRRANYQCERCHVRGTLDVHHRTYRNLGDERDDELEVLCRACHQSAHIPRNRKLPGLERVGQQRLFDRWECDRWEDDEEQAA